jgi:uncharacterized SAM-binding protein YcdF (DUF218 family)
VTYVQPLLLVLFLIVLAGLIRVKKGHGPGLAAAGLAGLFLLAWPPVDWLFSLPLEAPYYHRGQAPMESAQSIVVLSSSVNPPAYGLPFFVPDKDTYERCGLAAWLHTHGHPLPVLACGGGAPGTKPFSETMRELLQVSGVPESMIWTERRSRSTHENAVYGAAVLREHGIGTIILVTEAQDMLRAERCFRKEGLAVIPYPISLRTLGSALDELVPTWRAIDRNERTLHETLGLGWYWLRGWI